MAFCQLAWRFAIQRHYPDQLLGLFRSAARIWILTKAFQITAAGVNYRAGIGGPDELSDLFPIILAVGGNLASLVIRRFGYPDIPHAFCILHPGDSAV